MPFTRVFALAPDCHVAASRWARLWGVHFYEGLRGAVPEVIVPTDVDFAWSRPAADAPPDAPERATTSERLWDQICRASETGPLDAVVSYCFSSDVDPALVRRIVERGVPWINFFCDGAYAFDRVEAIARVVSLNWFPEHAAIGRYRALGRPILCRPYALHGAALTEAVCERADHRLGFVGAPSADRILRLAALRLRGCGAEVRGEGWTKAGRARRRAASPAVRRIRGSRLARLVARALRPVVASPGAVGLSDEEMVAFLSRCRVVLGLNEARDVHGRRRSYLKLRDVQFPGHGACYLTQANEDVDAAFDVGREVLTFRDAAEAAAHVDRCARHPDDARRIGKAGRLRVLAEHVWPARLAEIARAIS